MSNSKISALTSAATVVGTEVLPIVQSSATVKVTVANLTPGLGTITAAKGGTGQTSYAVGDILYADTTTTLAKLADVATGNALISGGVSTAPSWGKIGLTTHVSGTLPTANGGTNLTSFTANGIVYASSASVLATGSALVFDGTNMGIGVASPAAYLSLKNAATADKANSIRLFDAGGTNGNNYGFGMQNSTGEFSYTAGNSGFHTWYTANVERMRINSTGVGIGVTPAVKLDVLGTVQAAAAATQDAVRLAGRAGGTGTYAVTLTPTTLTASRTLTLPDATTTVVGTDATQTLTNKRIDPRVVSAASASSLTPSIATADIYAYTALAAGLTINAPTGTPVDGNKLMFRLLDNGTARALTWNATYTVIGVTLPTTTVANKTTYVGCIYNANNTRWDVIAVATQA